MSKPRTSYAFLMEMLWVCGFFGIAAGIFILAFVKADRISRNADSLNHAVSAAQNALEMTFALSGGASDGMVRAGMMEDRELCYDQNWNLLSPGEGTPSFVLRLSSCIESGMLHVAAEVSDTEGNSIYSLSGDRCLPPERSVP